MTALGVEQGAVYEIIGPLGDRAVIGPAPADPDFVGYLTEPPTGLERANVRSSGDDVADADGWLADDSLYGGIAFTMKGLVFPDAGAASSRQDKLMRATDAMIGDATLLWTSEVGVAVELDFRQDQPTRITERRPKIFTIAGHSESPVVKSQTERLTTILPDALVQGGFSFPLSFPLAFAPAVGGQATVVNAGRSRTYPRLLIFGPCQNPYVTNTRTGQTLFFNYTLTNGEYLEVNLDPGQRTVKLSGGTSRYSALDSSRSSWWPLLPGDNILRIGYSTFSAGAQVQVYHQDAWG